MSRAGKKIGDFVTKKRAATNLTLDEELRDWGVAYAEANKDEYRGSLSELLNKLLERKRAEESAKPGLKVAPQPEAQSKASPVPRQSKRAS